eukprot:757873-Hanusia_phi.AAC.2
MANPISGPVSGVAVARGLPPGLGVLLVGRNGAYDRVGKILLFLIRVEVVGSRDRNEIYAGVRCSGN